MRKYLVLLWILAFGAILVECTPNAQLSTVPVQGAMPTKCPTQGGNPEGKCGPGSKVTAGLVSTLPAGFTGTQVHVGNNAYYDISVGDLKNLLSSKDFLLINVHIPFEGNLPETDISIPYDQIDQNIMKLPADKKTKIVLYCRSGRMSTIAAEELVNLGYSHIMNLKGGMNAWENAGLPIEK